MNKSDYLRKNGVHSLYHFTHVFNVPLVARHGLLSKTLLRQRGLWEEIIPGGNEISHKEDRKKGNDHYVSLAYTPYFPMAFWRKKQHHICFFELDVSVVDKDGVLFTRGNATSREHYRCEDPSAILNPSDMRTILAGPPDRESPTWDSWHTISQSEVLIPDRVDPSAIKRCVVLTNDAKEICSISPSPFPIEVDKKPFLDGPNDDKVNFHYIEDLRIYGSVARFRIYLPNPSSKPSLELLLFDGPRSKSFDIIRKLVKDPKRKPQNPYPALLFGSNGSIVFGKLSPGKYTAFLYSYNENNIIPWSLKDFYPE